MGGPPPGRSTSETPPRERLDSWKEIAAHFDRDVTTVQRWEKREGMPVHRHVHDRVGSVYAFSAELDVWARSRNLRAAPENVSSVPSATPPTPPLSLPAAKSPARWRFVVLLMAAGILVLAAAILWLRKTEYFWRDPLVHARFQTVTDFEGVEQAAAVSRDGQFVAFLSDRDGQMDVWVTQVASGQLHNLTRGSQSELVNPSVRALRFSPDGSLVTFWVRRRDAKSEGDISIWAVPTLGGEARPYLAGAAELDWSHDGSRLAYHTPGPGDPLFVSDGSRRLDGQPIFKAPAGIHAHFPLWSPDDAFIYFVEGSLPDKLDIWRISPAGGTAEQITSHSRLVSHPVFLDRRTLIYLACDRDGSGPWLYSIDVERRISHHLSAGFDQYTSLAASADGRRLVLTRTSPEKTLWRLPLVDSLPELSTPVRISLTPHTGYSPRLGPKYMLFVSATSSSESIWKLANGTATELWNAQGAQVLGGPAIAPDGQHIAFSVRLHQQSFLYVMQADGTNARILNDALDLLGTPTWSPDGQSITVAANEHSFPHLFRVPLDGKPPVTFVAQYSVDAAWAPDGRFLAYSGADIGTTFSVKAVGANAAEYPIPALNLTRGARHLVVMPGGRALAFMGGEIRHKNLWLMDLQTGAKRQLTNLSADFDMRDFDISADGREVVLERVRDRSEVVLLDLDRQ